MIEKMNYYRWVIENSLFKEFRSSDLIIDIESCAQIHGFPTEKMIEEMKADILLIEDIKSWNYDRIMIFEQNGEIASEIKKRGIKIAELGFMVANVYVSLVDELLDLIMEKVDAVDMDNLAKVIEEKTKEYEKINKYNEMFSRDELLIKFTSDEELQEFNNLLLSMLDASKCEEILSCIRIDQAKTVERKNTINVSFDNLNLKQFTKEEKDIISEMYEIIADEELNKVVD